MRQFFFIAFLCCASALAATAQDSDLVTLETASESRGWEAVGRLDIQGKGFCTAALIDVHLILTAAHCIHDARGRKIDAERFTFSAGLRNGRAEATRDIISLTAHPDYVHQGSTAETSVVATDIAVLRLDRPIRRARLQPYPVASEPRPGDEVGVVSYARGRAELPSLQQVCDVMGEQQGVVIMSCDVDYGASGSPVFMVRNGRTSIVSVVSAMTELAGQKVSLGTSLGAPLRALLAHYNGAGPARPGGTQRLISTGQRNDTGAKFVRP
jgi:V8-like Glu-specific endopeptidase